MNLRYCAVQGEFNGKRLMRVRHASAIYLIVYAALALSNASCGRNSVVQHETDAAATLQSSPPTIMDSDAALWADEIDVLPTLSAETPCLVTVPVSDMSVPEWAGQRIDEPFDVASYLDNWKHKYDEAAECCYLSAMAEFSPTMASYTPEETRERRVKQAQLRQRRAKSIDPGSLNFFELWNTIQETNAAKLLEAIGPALHLIDKAQQSPACVFSLSLRYSQKIPQYEALRSLALLAAIEVRAIGADGEFARIEHVIKRILRASRDGRPRGAIVHQMVSLLVEQSIAKLITADVLHRADLTPEQCLQLFKTISQHEAAGIDQLSEAVKAEYVAAGNALWGLERGTVTFEEIDAADVSPKLARAVNYEAEWIALNQLFSLALDECINRPNHAALKQSVYEEKAQQLREQAVPKDVDFIGPDDKLPNSFVVVLIAPGIGKLREVLAHRQGRIGMIKSLLMIRRFELLYSRTPESLDEVFQDADAGPVPDDPYIAEPLRYRVIDQRIHVYSTGSDQKDDRAEQDWEWGNQPGDFSLWMFTPMPTLLNDSN